MNKKLSKFLGMKTIDPEDFYDIHIGIIIPELFKYLETITESEKFVKFNL